ncbi:annexin D5-like [Andrographis paniculata]|uniref:annexin D5-like n=1 Tax=Andrographis paniculata TaxID=175694 RepID=UPI0021E7B2B7|nr:annexin D5-like [Andrographis paniculata]
MATLTVPPVLTSPRDDAMSLYRAFKGFGCDTAAVISILAHRDATQRSLIEQEYKAMYSEELSKRLASELRGDVERAILAWMPDPGTRDATIVRDALAGDVIDLKAATEVICSRTQPQIQHFKQIYLAKFHAHLEQDIEYQASGDLQKLLLAYISTIRYQGPEVDRGRAEHDAKALFKAGEKKMGTDEDKFIKIFSQSSQAHLVAVDIAYDSMYGNSLRKAIKSETSGNFEFALLTILQCAKNPAKYFAKVLHKAMEGLGTNDKTLTRVIVTRTEIDMQYIKAEYEKKYKKSLNDAVHSETSSHYRTFLLSLLGATHR